MVQFKAPINRETYRAALGLALATKGADYVYPNARPGNDAGANCFYIENRNEADECPSCIHGHALAILGHTVSPEDEGVNIRTVLQSMGVQDVDLTDAARASQAVQDSGGTWGSAVERFDWVLNRERI